MGFISKAASKIAAGGGGGTGGYLTAGKLGDGESYRIAITSPEPIEYFPLGRKRRRQKPSVSLQNQQDEIKEELGDFVQRMNYDGTDVESQSLLWLSSATTTLQDQSLRDHSKTLIKARQAVERRGLQRSPRVGSQVRSHWSQDGHRIQHSAGAPQVRRPRSHR